MKLKSIVLAFFLLNSCLACSSKPERSIERGLTYAGLADQPGHLHQNQPTLNLQPGGRKSLHGMVIFGNGSYFIEHIPMLHPPHDFQIIASVKIHDINGNTLKPNLANEGFTLKPNNQFSLNDFLAGKIKRFSAEIYQGSFEQSGSILNGYEKVEIAIQKIELARQLPDESNQNFFEAIDSSGNIFKSSIITPKNNVQQILNKTTSKQLWCVVGPDFFEPC